MTCDEFSREFDIRFNYVNSNLAYSVNEYEKSVYLTRAQEQILDNYFDPSRNSSGAGFDDTPKREVDFSSVIRPFSSTSDSNSLYPPYNYNAKTFVVVGDILKILDGTFEYRTSSDRLVLTSVRPLDFKSYSILMAKPHKDPPSGISWRQIRSRTNAGGIVLEVIHSGSLQNALGYKFSCRYLERPTPIVVDTLPAGFSVNGVSVKTECSLPPEIHDEVLNRAIELCKIDYIGDAPGMVELNKRGE